MNTPKVSVILPVYNEERYLSQCLDSILGQTLKEIEILCIDAGSTDASLEILENYARKDARIVICSGKGRLDAGSARNIGLSMAAGEYLSFLDSDDFFEPGMLECALEAAEKYRADFVVFQSNQFLMDKGQFIETPWVLHLKDIPPYMPFSYRQLTDNVFKTFVGWAWDKLYRRSFVQEHRLRFQEQRTTNDMLFVFSALVTAKRIAVVNKVLAHHRRGDSRSLSVTREKSWHCFYDALLALRQRLNEEGIFWELEKDYVNYALHFSLWHLNSLAEPSHSLLKEKLCSAWFSELGITGRPEEYFYDQAEYAQYRKLRKE